MESTKKLSAVGRKIDVIINDDDAGTESCSSKNRKRQRWNDDEKEATTTTTKLNNTNNIENNNKDNKNNAINNDNDGKRRNKDDENDDGPSTTQKQCATRTITTKIITNTPTVFIGGLHPRVAQVHLEKLMNPYGTIKRIHLVLTDNRIQPEQQEQQQRQHPNLLPPSPHRGYAFCEYETIEQAQAAINTLNGRQLLGKSLSVRPAHKNTNIDSHDGGDPRDSSSRATSSQTTTTIPTHKERQVIDDKIAAVKQKLAKLQKR